MAFRRRFRRVFRRFRRRKSGFTRISRRPRRRVTRSISKANYLQTCFVKLRTVVPVFEPDTTAATAITFNFNNDLTSTTTAQSVIEQWRNSSSTGYSFATASNYYAIWEQRRIAGFKIQWIPSVTQEAIVNVGTASFVPFYFIKDLTSFSATINDSVTVAAMLNESHMRVKNLWRPFTMYVRAMKYGLMSKVPYLSSTSNNYAGQWTPIGDTSGDVHLAFWTTQSYGNMNRPLGQFIVTAYTIFKDRQA